MVGKGTTFALIEHQVWNWALRLAFWMVAAPLHRVYRLTMTARKVCA